MMRNFLLLCLLSVLFAWTCAAAGRPGVEEESIVLPTERCGDYFIAETMIDGRGPFRMVLDTGASATLLSPDAFRRAGRPRHIEQLSIGGFEVTGRIRVTTKQIEHLEDGLGIPIDGILGHQVFQRVLLTYDYPGSAVRVRRGALLDDEPGVAQMSTSKRPFIGARIGEVELNVLLDTGSSNGLTLGQFDEWVFVEPPPVVGGSIGVDGLSAVRAGRLEGDVRFGSFTLATPIVRSTAGDSLLGQAVLRDFVVTLDQQRGRVQIVKPDGTKLGEPMTTPSLFDASWVLWPEAEYLVVRYLVTGGAAEQAGFQTGDRILSIDGMPWAETGCERHDRNTDGPETTRYTIERDGKSLHLDMTTQLVVE